MSLPIAPAELIQLLNFTAKAPATVGEGFALAEILRKAVDLANQPYPIGALEPVKPASPDGPAMIPNKNGVLTDSDLVALPPIPKE